MGARQQAPTYACVGGSDQATTLPYEDNLNLRNIVNILYHHHHHHNNHHHNNHSAPQQQSITTTRVHHNHNRSPSQQPFTKTTTITVHYNRKRSLQPQPFTTITTVHQNHNRSPPQQPQWTRRPIQLKQQPNGQGRTNETRAPDGTLPLELQPPAPFSSAILCFPSIITIPISRPSDASGYKPSHSDNTLTRTVPRLWVQASPLRKDVWQANSATTHKGRLIFSYTCTHVPACTQTPKDEYRTSMSGSLVQGPEGRFGLGVANQQENSSKTEDELGEKENADAQYKAQTEVHRRTRTQNPSPPYPSIFKAFYLTVKMDSPPAPPMHRLHSTPLHQVLAPPVARHRLLINGELRSQSISIESQEALVVMMMQ
ncbi:uncharacterized protein LOC134775672 [Penaeus indicus]|uniref:uncharacterized protein LOC134775672 n=1 Tax=Penaeus indicus TaxID=29960 RepID=UPI00300CAAF5